MGAFDPALAGVRFASGSEALFRLTMLPSRDDEKFRGDFGGATLLRARNGRRLAPDNDLATRDRRLLERGIIRCLIDVFCRNPNVGSLPLEQWVDLTADHVLDRH